MDRIKTDVALVTLKNDRYGANVTSIGYESRVASIVSLLDDETIDFSIREISAGSERKKESEGRDVCDLFDRPGENAIKCAHELAAPTNFPRACAACAYVEGNHECRRHSICREPIAIESDANLRKCAVSAFLYFLLNCQRSLRRERDREREREGKREREISTRTRDYLLENCGDSVRRQAAILQQRFNFKFLINIA